ncbi:MAG: hypothetical protein ACI9EF_001653 [Pseudohongiellaceae bacterium]|jgi:hypothetical protein
MSAEWTVARTIPSSRDVVWDWLQIPENIFSLNILHARVDCAEKRMAKGTTANVLHRMGFKTELRVLTVKAWEPYRLSWSDLYEDGADFFPHAQQLKLTETDVGHCQVENRLSGRFVVPRWLQWSLPLYDVVGPQILQAELRKLGRWVVGGGCEVKAKRS